MQLGKRDGGKRDGACAIGRVVEEVMLEWTEMMLTRMERVHLLILNDEFGR